MKWVFFSLVIINGAVFGWFSLSSDKSTARATPVESKIGAVPKLILLSELERVPEKLELKLEYTEPNEQQLCEMIGPFKADSSSEAIVERLAALGVPSESRLIEVPGDMTYWVYQGPFVSQREALTKLYELQSMGIDSYVIPKGELANSISFGVFTRRLGAEAKLSEITEYGYESAIHEIQRVDQEIWVVLSVQSARDLADSAWLSVMDHPESPQRRQNYCSGVASS